MSCSFPPKGFGKVRNAQRRNWEDLQEVQKRVSFVFCLLADSVLSQHWVSCESNNR